MNILKYVAFGLFLFFISCEEHTPLENVLKLAGENRNQLEKVLEHYKHDTLKSKAAVFLIENLPGHYSFSDTLFYNKYCDEIDSLANLYNFPHHHRRDSLYNIIRNKYDSLTKDNKYTADIKFITADYLINNIDSAFSVWQNNPFTRHVGFDDFCEYILPYKCMETQALDNWREYFRDYSKQALSELEFCDQYKNSVHKACEVINDDIRNKIHPNLWADDGTPIIRMKSRLRAPYGSCDNYCILALAVMRAQGIPTAIDYTPQWPFRSMGHSWNVLLDNNGKNVIFEGVFSRPGLPHKEDHKMAKVYRRTYSANKDIINLHKKEKHIPRSFITPFFKDVTDEYMKTADVTIRVKGNNDHSYAYLAVFDNQTWIPIHWSKKNGKTFTFEKMGKDIMYLPIYYTRLGIEAFEDPILLTIKGETIVFKADTAQKKDILLYRKYPPMTNMHDISGRVINGKFQASNDASFTDSLTVNVHIIKERAVIAKQILLDSIDTKYRYWRYLSPNGAYCNMAEIYFYEKDSLKEITGKVIGTEGSWRPLNEGYTKEGAFDRDALTFFDAPQSDNAWVGMDFGEPINIGKINYLPRNDGNCIEAGDEYELMYWANGIWQSMGKKIADDVCLKYENCPANALFLLHNHTKGKEERIFTYEDGKQVWW